MKVTSGRVQGAAQCARVHGMPKCQRFAPPGPASARSLEGMASVRKRRAELHGIHYASDADDASVLPASDPESEADVPDPPHRASTSLNNLVQRECKCSAKDCFTQFKAAASIEALRAARADYAALPKDMQDVYISLNCLKQDPFERLGHAGAGADVLLASESEAGSEHAVLYASGDASDGVLYASDCEECAEPKNWQQAAQRTGSECAEPKNWQQAAQRTGSKRKYRQRTGSKQRTCAFGGKPVCQQAFARLLGIGGSKIDRVRRGERSMANMKQPKHPTLGFSMILKSYAVWPSVVMFLWMTYHTCAEGLPDRLLNLYELRDSTGLVEKYGRDPAPGGNNELDRTVGKIALDLANYGTDPDMVLKGPGFLSGPRRYLQHDAPIHLFWEYRSWCANHGQKQASYSTFLRVFRKVFRGHLQFRKGGGAQHAECSTCSGLKNEMKTAPSYRSRVEVLERYAEHLLLQWLDRQVWWALGLVSVSWFQKSSQLGREAAFASVSLSCIAIIIDGMDQAKFRIPRARYVQRAAKAMEMLHRPSLHVIGLWIQGAALELAVGDEDLRKDSSTQLEVLARGLTKTLERFGGLPLGLHLQQDNCVREGKNTHVANFMLAMVLLGIFKWAQLGYLRKGHTHENIDQVKPALKH